MAGYLFSNWLELEWALIHIVQFFVSYGDFLSCRGAHEKSREKNWIIKQQKLHDSAFKKNTCSFY